MTDIVAPEPREQPDPAAGRHLADVLRDDTFAQACGLGGLVVEARFGALAALWRGSPWGSGWVAGGTADGIARLLDEDTPSELTLPESLGLPPGHRLGWGWGWHALRTPPPVQPREGQVGWLTENDPDLVELVASAFPDAEAPPGDPRVRRWFGARQDGRLVACAAELRTEPAVALLSSLTVDPSARRHGWGAAVTAWHARTCLAGGAQVVGLGTYRGNTVARVLYGRLGFADVPYLGAVREN
ncbi:MAG TPA: GNAT family N-acetyltransferase [Frankiaceae bacterium]|nr:GNAT family N-acetyltransferase [Frankiaceae bacterium]